MRILYLGLPLGAVVLARNGFIPSVVCLGHPEAQGARRVRTRMRGSLVLGRPDLGSPSLLEVLRRARPDALLCFFWPKRIPESVLALPRLGAYGTHPSLLPRHRGPDPYFWTLDAGDEETGVSLHALEASYDTGAVIASRRIPVREEYDSFRLARALDRPALALLVEAAQRLAATDRPLVGTPQDDALATAAPTPDDDATSLDFHAGVTAILRRVRACAPTPGALAEVEGRTFEIVRAVEHLGSLPRGLRPSEACVVDDHAVVVARDGAIRVLEARDEDGERTDLAAWLRERARAQMP